MLLSCGVGEKTLESPLECKEILSVHPKGDQSWVFISRTDVEAEWFESAAHPPSSPYWARVRGISGDLGRLTSVTWYIAIASRSENLAEPGLARTCRYHFHFNKEDSIADHCYKTYFYYRVHKRNHSPPDNWLCLVTASAPIVPSTQLLVATLVVK